jgi:uncharacterized protein
MGTLADRDAIDMHVHVMEGGGGGSDEASRAFAEAAGRYFKSNATSSLPGIAEYYEERNLGCVVFTVDSESATGRKPVPNEEIAQFAGQRPDLMVPFASVDPWRGQVALAAIRRLVRDHGVQGFKFHPATQAFYPNDTRFYALYEAIEEAQVPVVFHTGQTGIGLNMKGGGGIRLKYSNPLFIDDVAADFPDLTIIMAHPSVPWQDEGLAVALHKPTVYMDLSGWSPKYFEPKLVTYMRRLLSDKVLFGSDFPVLTPDRWLKDFEPLEIEDEIRQKILKDNALRVLGIM